MSNHPFMKAWKRQEPLLELLVQMFDPFLEISVHDLEKKTLAGIYNNFSQKEVGAPSQLSELNISDSNLPDLFHPYYKKKWDGHPIKSGSYTLRDDEGRPIGLISLNVDVSLFSQFQQKLSHFLMTHQDVTGPLDLYGQNCREQVVSTVQTYLSSQSLTMGELKRFHKKKIVALLYQRGVFNFKNAPPFVAKYINISRATVYNYLKEIES